MIDGPIKPEFSDDGFKLVKSKSKRLNTKPIRDLNTCLSNVNFTENIKAHKQDAIELGKKVEALKIKLKNYDQHFYWSKLKLVLSNLVKNYFKSFLSSSATTKQINIICYGLGSIDNEFASRYQFALLLLIIDEIKEMSFNLDSIGSNSSTEIKINSVELYDPVFSEIDKKLLTDIYSFKLESINKKCMKSIDLLSEKNHTVLNLFYMPHCGKALYNNLLCSNWSINNLNNLIILGNSFTTMMLNTLESVMLKNYSFIKDSSCFVNEIKLENNCEFTNAFYDLSFHTFNLEQDKIRNFTLCNKLEATLNVAKIIEPLYDQNIDEIF